MTRRGFTLLEMLAALSLLSVVVAGASHWLVGVARTQRAVTNAARDGAALAWAMEALRLDLESAARPPAVDTQGGALEVRTSAALSGPPGWRDIRWSFDESSGALLRHERPLRGGDTRERVVIEGVLAWRVGEAVRAGEDDAVGAVRRGDSAAAVEVVIEVVIELRGGRSAELVWRAP